MVSCNGRAASWFIPYAQRQDQMNIPSLKGKLSDENR